MVAWFLGSVVAVGVSRLLFSAVQPLPFYIQYNPGFALIPVVGMLFGPAGAWGSLVGVVLADGLGGLMSWLTPFRAFGAFLAAFSAQLLCGNGWLSAPKKKRQEVSSFGMAVRFLLAAVPGCLLAASWEGFGSEWLRLYPFPYVTSLLLAQYLAFAALIGTPLFVWGGHRLARQGRTWQAVLCGDGQAHTRRMRVLLIWGSSLAVPAVGMAVSWHIYHIGPLSPFIVGVTDCPWTLIALVPLLFLQLFSLFGFGGKAG